ncbi:polysaccharide biosynthesis/export family protein [Tateyamaria pelophila]|uniref:polysaccharide biosynthesis/export family protein n=1 Tax=Tateyamaria pelophila TaxID=328415 RepID=UPI001CBD56F1|nr:polysaccharide biosynthesis/export family protein [Tateyamaria pelophila]
MQNPVRAVLVCLTVLLVGACSLPRGSAIQEEITLSQSSAEAPFAVVPVSRSNINALRTWPMTGSSQKYGWFSGQSGPKSNIIRTGDNIRLVIWDNQENSLLTSNEQKNVTMDDLEVGPSGTIFVPYINEVVVRGKTPELARADIEQRMEMVVPAAQVQLRVTPGLDNSVDAVGGFTSPGTYPLSSRNVSILSMISQAGGIAPDLENPLVRVIRGGNTYEIRSDKLFETASANVVLRGGDKIIVEEDERYFIGLGATGNEQIVPFDRENITAIEALAMLGGLNEVRANLKGILILREYDRDDVRIDSSGPEKRQVVFAIDLTSADGLFAAGKFNIHPNDLVMATESPVTALNTIFGLIGRLLGFQAILSN